MLIELVMLYIKQLKADRYIIYLLFNILTYLTYSFINLVIIIFFRPEHMTWAEHLQQPILPLQ